MTVPDLDLLQPPISVDAAATTATVSTKKGRDI
jgi:hypothetical protein